MTNLDKYVEEIKEYLNLHPEISETEMIRYVYLDLGNKFSFDEKFTPFGNSKFKQTLYRYHSSKIVDLEECMETNLIICKSVSHILKYVLTKLGVNIIIKVDQEDLRKCPHVYNRIKEKSGKEYDVDLQEDIYNIQSHSFTKNFGIHSIYDMALIISRFEQEQMDRKNGYLKNGEKYADDYLYLLHSVADLLDDFDEKAKFVIENIDAVSTQKMGYTDRLWHHKSVLESFFDTTEFDYDNDKGKIRTLDCYKKTDNKIMYLNCLYLKTKNGQQIYIYNKKENCYIPIAFEKFAEAVNNGVVINNKKGIPGLNNATKKIKSVEEK